MMGNGLVGAAVTNIKSYRSPAWPAYLAYQPAYLWIPSLRAPESHEEISRAHMLALPVPVSSRTLDPFFVPYYLAAKIDAVAAADMASRGQALDPSVLTAHIGARLAHYGMLAKGSVAPEKMVGGTERFIIANPSFLYLARHLAESEGVIVDPHEYKCPSYELDTFLVDLKASLP